MHIKSRRVWVGISDPSSPNRKLDDEASETLQVWLQLLVSTPFSLSMCPPTWIPVQATADAMASTSMAGLGGAAIFPNGSSVWFQLHISLTEAQALWPWLGDDMQKHIAAWELLAQFALRSLPYPFALKLIYPKHVARLRANKARIIAQLMQPLPRVSL